MQATLSGRLVGFVDESWPAKGDRQAGRRVELFLQGNPAGLGAPERIWVAPEHRDSCTGLTFGIELTVPVSAETFRGSDVLSIRTMGPVVRSQAPAARTAA